MNAHSPAAKTAIVIGAGFGGLALAIRLQSAGIATTLVEARDKPGGRAYVWHDQGHVFDAGPTVITDPDALKELWALTGQDMARDVTLMPVSPFYRLMWPGGKVFDYVNEADQLERQIAQFNPDDLEGYRRFRDYAEEVYQEGYVKLGTVPFLKLGQMLKAAPLCGRINVTAAFLPGMVAQGRGRIINVARPVPRPPLPGNLGFAVAQAGADILTRTLSVEVGGRLPGIVVTEWVPDLDPAHGPDQAAGLGAALALNDDPALHGATVLGDRQILPGRSLRRRVLDLLLLKPAARPIVLAPEPTSLKETT